jgi:hypothetical protein
MLSGVVTKTAAYLQDHGRTVMFWGEFPMMSEDVASQPSYPG